ncbi:hypothetical protein ANN_15490 [Periplaneta americana]|uniref:Uncharacterized protein n=1 Tax=Periplaneta americana TaxID=6978 RepID=A0ABQ8SHN5_PERAM|nr:hypothetical protein ANN_15490 [Periplaneta americana]
MLTTRYLHRSPQLRHVAVKQQPAGRSWPFVAEELLKRKLTQSEAVFDGDKLCELVKQWKSLSVVISE